MNSQFKIKTNSLSAFAIEHRYFLLSLIFTLVFTIWNALEHPSFFDDAFIAMRISKNFILGNGLYHNLQEKVQTNTSIFAPLFYSPIHLFKPEIAIKITIVIDLLLMSITTLIVYSAIVKQINKPLNILSKIALSFLPFKLFLAHIVCFGMETQLYLLIIAIVYYAFASKRFKSMLLISAIAIFIRPDGILLYVSASLLYLLNFDDENIRFRFDRLFVTVLIGIIPILYFLFIKLYYGSWIPQTVIAKSLIQFSPEYSIMFFLKQIIISERFIPNISNFLILSFIFIRQKRNINILVVFGILYSILFISRGAFIPAFGWYLSPIRFIISIIIIYSIYLLINNSVNIYIKISLLLLLSLSTFHTCYANIFNWKNSVYFEQLSMTKELRPLIDKVPSLKGNIFLTTEPLGYFSYLNMDLIFCDYPGLASKKASEIIKKSNHKITLKNFNRNMAYLDLLKSNIQDIVILRKPEYEFYVKSLPQYRLIGILNQNEQDNFIRNMHVMINTSRVRYNPNQNAK